jgi:hypothetical protein
MACSRPSVAVRQRPPLAVAIVTHFVTQSSCERGRLLTWWEGVPRCSILMTIYVPENLDSLVQVFYCIYEWF